MRTRALALLMIVLSGLCGCALTPPTSEQLAERDRDARELCQRSRGGWRETAPGFGGCVWGGR
jgi:hypothetical protein